MNNSSQSAPPKMLRAKEEFSASNGNQPPHPVSLENHQSGKVKRTDPIGMQL